MRALTALEQPTRERAIERLQESVILLFTDALVGVARLGLLLNQGIKGSSLPSFL
jgi:hypothetical protein